jgi:hypothetical protein
MMITEIDPRSGMFVRKMETISRSEPDLDYFTIPGDCVFGQPDDGQKIASA